MLNSNEANLAARALLKKGRTKIKSSDLRRLRGEYPWEILRATTGRLEQDERKVSLFIGLGSEYAPKLGRALSRKILYRGYAIERLAFLTSRRWLAGLIAGAAFLIAHWSRGGLQMIVVAFSDGDHCRLVPVAA